MKNLLALSICASFLLTPAFAEEVSTNQTPITEDQAIQMVKVEKSPILLQSHLRKRFAAYKVTVTNQYPGNLDLTSASVDNGTQGTIAADSTSTSYVNVLWGLPLWLLGMGIAAVVISGKNSKAETEGAQFSNQVPTNTLMKNDSLTFNTLVPTGETPHVKLHFEDHKTGLAFVKNII